MNTMQMPLDFDGPGLTAADRVRLTGQFARVFRVMESGLWLALDEIEAETGDPQASISARLRDFRKTKFGGHTVERKRATWVGGGTWVYRLTRNPHTEMELT